MTMTQFGERFCPIPAQRHVKSGPFTDRPDEFTDGPFVIDDEKRRSLRGRERHRRCILADEIGGFAPAFAPAPVHIRKV